MITKTISEDERFCTHESDIFMIKKVGTEEIYGSATDLNPCMFEYEETDIPLYTGEVEDPTIQEEEGGVVEDPTIPEEEGGVVEDPTL